jgi:quercetin dioxygenase-like cupin family protein
MEWAQGETKPDTGAYKPAEGPATRGSVLNAARAIVVEFRQPAPKAARTPSLPPPYKAVSENAHAVQFEATATPGQVTPLHTHSNHVLIALADGTVELTDPSGKKEKLELKKDTVKFGPPMTHTSANAGSTPLHWVLIELK